MSFLKSSLLSNSLIFLLASIVNAAIPFFLLPILTRVLLPEDYGVISLFSVLLASFGAIAGLSIHGGLSIKYFKVSQKELAQYVGACLIVLLVSTTMVLALVVLGADYLVGYFKMPAQWIITALLFAALQFLINVRMSLWQSAGNAVPYAAFQIGQSLVNISLSLIFVIMMHMSWQGRLLGQVTAIGTMSVISAISLRMDGYLAWPVNLIKNAKEALRFGVPLVPHALGAILLAMIDRIVIAKKLGLASAGLYMAALQLAQVVLIVVDSLNKAFSPWLIRKLNSGGVEKIAIVKATYVFFAVNFLFSVIYGLSAPLLLSFMVGDKFRGTEEVVLFSSFAYFLTGCYYAVTNYIFYTSRTEVLALITALTAMMHFVLVNIFVSYNGMIGAAQALVISNFVSFCGTWYASQKLHPMPWFNLSKNI